MAKDRFTKEEIEVLKKNPFVINVNEVRILYSDDFKKHFIEEYRKGVGPTQIFRDAGFDPKVIGGKRIERAAARWRKAFKEPLNENLK